MNGRNREAHNKGGRLLIEIYMRKFGVALVLVTSLKPAAALAGFNIFTLQLPKWAAPLTDQAGLNNLGHVSDLVQFYSPGGGIPAIWTSGSPTYLQSNRGDLGSPVGINDKDHVVGSVSISPTREYAYILANGSVQQLPGPGGANSMAFAINNNDQVAGAEQTILGDTNLNRAMIWTNGSPLNLAADALPSSEALDINDSGKAVGISYIDPNIDIKNYKYTAFTWEKGKTTYLPGFGGRLTQAAAVNNSGFVVGLSTDAAETESAVEWDPAGRIHSLGTLYGGGTSQAFDINDQGDAVGVSLLPDLVGEAVLFTNGKVENLNDLVPADANLHLVAGLDINDSGQILAEGSRNGQDSLFVLSPDLFAHPINQVDGIPEPACGLVISAVVGCSLFRRRASRRLHGS